MKESQPQKQEKGFDFSIFVKDARMLKRIQEIELPRRKPEKIAFYI